MTVHFWGLNTIFLMKTNSSNQRPLCVRIRDKYTHCVYAEEVPKIRTLRENIPMLSKL